jgi:hypothetical protein
LQLCKKERRGKERKEKYGKDQKRNKQEGGINKEEIV